MCVCVCMHSIVTVDAPHYTIGADPARAFELAREVIQAPACVIAIR